MEKNRKFKVWARYYNYCYIEVEAKSKKEAEEKAEQIDGGDFIPYNESSWLDDGGWEIVNEMTEEVR